MCVTKSNLLLAAGHTTNTSEISARARNAFILKTRPRRWQASVPKSHLTWKVEIQALKGYVVGYCKLLVPESFVLTAVHIGLVIVFL